MAKRRVFNGVYKRSNSPCRSANATQNGKELKKLAHTMIKYLRMAYSIVAANYVTIVTISVIFFALFLPFSYTHRSNDLNAIKKVLDQMTAEVTRAEVACLTAAEDICSLRCSICDEQTETGIRRLRNYETYQFAQAGDCSRNDRKSCKLKRKSVSFAVSSPSIETSRRRVQVYLKKKEKPTSKRSSRYVILEIAIMSITYTDSFGT